MVVQVCVPVSGLLVYPRAQVTVLVDPDGGVEEVDFSSRVFEIKLDRWVYSVDVLK